MERRNRRRTKDLEMAKTTSDEQLYKHSHTKQDLYIVCCCGVQHCHVYEAQMAATQYMYVRRESTQRRMTLAQQASNNCAKVTCMYVCVCVCFTGQ